MQPPPWCNNMGKEGKEIWGEKKNGEGVDDVEGSGGEEGECPS